MSIDDKSAIDNDKLKAYAFLFFSKYEGAVTAGMVHLGDRLGLYAAMADGEPTTSAGLAEKTGLHERWVREWLHNQAAAKLVAWDAVEGVERYWLTPEAIAVTADPSHPSYGMGFFFRLPQTMAVLEPLAESFRTGIGLPYDAMGLEGAVGVERSFEPWYRNYLVPVTLPMLDGVVERLSTGTTAADVGCGAGVAVVTMAGAFPLSQFHGYDISEHALARAEERKEKAGAGNAHFHNARVDPLPSDNSLSLVTTFDCLHDMTDPGSIMKAIRSAIRPDGVWLVADIKARDTFAENVQKNPMASMMYAVSVLSCMSSALSEHGGAGLGTLGMPASLLQQMAQEAGFTRFRKLDLDHPVNAFYEIRP